MTFADGIAKDRGQPATVRIGTVASVAPLIVLVQETQVTNAGVLDGYVPVVGHVVAMLGQSAVSADGSSWLVLGRVLASTAGALSAISVSSNTDNVAVSTASVTYVPLGVTSPGVAFRAPSSGRVAVHWRTATAAAVAALAWTSFRLGLDSVIGAGTVIQPAQDDVAILNGGTASLDMGTSTLLPTLAPGVVYNVQLQHRTTVGTSFWNRRQILVVPVP